MRTASFIRFCFSSHTRYCIVGLGSGGLSLTSHLLRSGVHPSEIRVIDPSPKHYYQPGWTMIGAGLWEIMSTEATMESVAPKEITFNKDRLQLVKPEENKVVCESGQEYTYDELILGTGLRLQYEKVQGLKEALDDPHSNVTSIYELKYAEKVAQLGEKLRSGKAIFTESAMPIKCAGAPQKILYLWTDKWSKRKLPIEVEFIKTNAVMFGVPKYSNKLAEVAASYGISTTFKHPLVKVDGN
jgi:NADPH-dependent 2,4-dienoyl-CoA reductase/sulfur reductase-like enzyme